MESTTIDICAACGKEGGHNLKACTACFMVKYCNRDCQISHRKQHKKECKKRAAEIYDEKLFKEVEPDECPICMLSLPSADETTFKSCCGKRICHGCIYAIEMSDGKDLCAFCRTPPIVSEEEEIQRVNKLVDKGNAEAYFLLAGYYTRGYQGLQQNDRKAFELMRKAGELGCAQACANVAIFYRQGIGVAIDEEKAMHYSRLAAMAGNIYARYNLGCLEGQAGNTDRAFKHYIIAARAGHDKSLNVVKEGFIRGFVTKDEYANTLRAYQKRQDEMNSDERDKAALLRRTGEWHLTT